MDWNNLAQYRDQCQDLVNTIMKHTNKLLILNSKELM